ncbi:phage integrase N-terminal SAM-like domain-containing protein [Agaribacterium haliotis]|uniref:phage integrase N-terminal SAM-like domain-containing protein n=1 Tax=Agaribacterium haliotis TaxID=2013869 RepID=UPI000BB59263|nr:phage integrase N-terminal SAM-like domain-containing protein [Agaribacterium haliotis]
MEDVRPVLPSQPERFMHRFRYFIREQGLSYSTEKTYVHWVKRYIHFHNQRHPFSMQAADIDQFLSFVGVQRNCSVNTQRIALNAMVFLYERFLGIKVGNLNYRAAKGPKRLPLVYSREEIRAILNQLLGHNRLMVELMYGGGLRSAELLALRIKDIDLDANNIIVRSGKGGKDRLTVLPKGSLPALKIQIPSYPRKVDTLYSYI